MTQHFIAWEISKSAQIVMLLWLLLLVVKGCHRVRLTVLELLVVEIAAVEIVFLGEKITTVVLMGVVLGVGIPVVVGAGWVRALVVNVNVRIVSCTCRRN